jgi:hypothetical protein
MSLDKTQLPTYCSPKSVTSLVGVKTISGATAYKHASVAVVELAFNDSTTGFIKVGPNSTIEIGGTAEMGTGTKVSW